MRCLTRWDYIAGLNIVRLFELCCLEIRLVENYIVYEVLRLEKDVELLFVKLTLVGKRFNAFSSGFPIFEDFRILLFEQSVALFEFVVFTEQLFLCVGH